ncbi:hypothetical protein AA0488_0464 [Kozakia baliensis NRIC 0488]|nr:hypothetical protein AA0488_0464 [Kozakia baliensis NRIC 0488]
MSSFGTNNGTGADEAHLKAQHIEQLREFIKARLAKDPPHFCNARIVCQFLSCCPFSARRRIIFEKIMQNLACIRHHTTELEATERLPITPNASMPEHCRTTITLYQNEKQRKNWQDKYE